MGLFFEKEELRFIKTIPCARKMKPFLLFVLMFSRAACCCWRAAKARISPAAWTHLTGGDSVVTHRLLADSNKKNIPDISGISGVGALQLHLASFPMNMQRVQSRQVAQSGSGAEAEQVLLWRCELLALNIHVVHILYLGRCSPACKTEQKWDFFLFFVQFQAFDAVIFGCSVSPSGDRFTDECNFCFAAILFGDLIHFRPFVLTNKMRHAHASIWALPEPKCLQSFLPALLRGERGSRPVNKEGRNIIWIGF